MIAFSELLVQSFEKMWISFTHNWPFLIASVVISVFLKLYLNPKKVSAFITRYQRVGVLGATAAAVGTPLCSCGTTAVVLGMIASTIPWAPVVAFMVASPLTSPEELIYSAGIFGWPFAIAFFAASIVLGLLGGAVAEVLDRRGWLANQTRFSIQTRQEGEDASVSIGQTCACSASPALVVRQPAGAPRPAADAHLSLVVEGGGCGCGPVAVIEASTGGCGCGSAPVNEIPSSKCGCGSNLVDNQPADGGLLPDQEKAFQKVTLKQFLSETFQTGKTLLFMFLGFAYLGYFLNGLIPTEWVSALFGSGNIYSIPLAAVLGLPFYINTEGSLPLVRALIDGGMSQGAALAFLITGAGTSVGAVGGMLTIARWRVVGLVIGTLLVGSVVIGYGYNALLVMHVF